MTQTTFGRLPDGRAARLYALRAGALEMRVTDWGAIIVSLACPDRDGARDDVVRGHDTLDGYLDASPYFGAVVGRYANRIADGRFTLDGREHRLTTNDGPHHVHGGRTGFDRRLWDAVALQDATGVGLRLRLTSEDGDEGYPGRLEAEVTYRLDARGRVTVDYCARTDRATPVNLTQHTYWNLAGARADTIVDHVLTLAADRYTPVDAGLIPTGEIAPVAGTPFDFRTPRAIGERVDDDHPQLRATGGYDHNHVLSGPADATGLRHAARVVEPRTGRALDVHTTAPGVQLYSGNLLDGTIRGKRGRTIHHRGGLCLETQEFPNAPNEPGFPSAIVRPGEVWRSRTVFALRADG